MRDGKSKPACMYRSSILPDMGRSWIRVLVDPPQGSVVVCGVVCYEAV